MKRIALTVLALIVALVAAWFALAPESRGTGHGGFLISRLNSDIISTEPGDQRDENTDSVLMHVGEGLVGLREDGSVGLLLASAVKISEDGKVYDFTLRSGVRFHNGAPLSADSVVWSLRRYLREDSDWRCRSDLTGGIADILEVSALDAAHVRITLAAAAPLLLKTLARIDCAGAPVLHPDSVNADGSWNRPIGTGPFRFSRHVPNQYVELLRFDEYSPLSGPMDGNVGNKKPLVPGVRFLIIPDSSAAAAALMSGGIDIYDGVNPNEMDVLEKTDDIRIESVPLMDVYALLLQTRDPLLKDARLRRAIALSIDVGGLAVAVSNGTAGANSSMVPVPSPFHKGVHKVLIQKNLAEARRLVAASGYRGEPITLITNRRYLQMFDAAVLIQAMARDAGINFEIQTFDWATQLDHYSEGTYQTMTFAYSARLDPSFNYGSVIGNKDDEPRKVWDDPVAADLLSRSAQATAAADRQAAFDALHTRMLTETPLVVTYNPAHIIATRAGVEGARSWPAVQQRLWSVSKK